MNQNTDSEAKERLKPLQESVTFRVKDREPTTGEKTEKTITGTLTVEYSASRAKKDQADRDKLIKKMRSKVGLGPTNPKNLISNQGYKKFIAVTETGTIKLNEEKIKADGLWDGLHGIFSNLNLSPEEIRARYKHLWTIEETFRISKHDLEIRPMYHWKPKRILAHISICYISLAIARHIELTLKNEGISMSVRRIAQAISSIQACTIRDKRTGNRFKFPVQLNSDSRAVLQALRIPYRSGAVSI